jgi:MtrB/PioB family decaheme-associated outer membrane protein
MKTGKGKFAVSATWLAVQGALFAMCAAPLVAMAQDETDEDTVAYQALISPTNYVELGALYVSKDSPKFGEYNGLDKSGGYAVGNFQVQGGDAYGMGGGTTHWDINGTNLGTTSRELGASITNQGHWNLGIDFDQLRHFTTGGTYQTPYQGSMGGNTFILPNTFGVINTTATTNATTGVITSASKGAQTLTANQLSAFHTENVYSERKNIGVSAGYNFNPQWDVKFDFKRVDQSGAKLIGSGTDVFAGGPGGFNYGGERVAILMNPTNYTTDNINLALNWVGDKGHVSASYYGSLFDDANKGLSWSNPWVSGGTGAAPNPPTGTDPGSPFPISTMSTPPDNQFHQLNLSGGYNFTTATKLAGGLSYGRNTQNDSYAGTFTTTPNTATVLPVSSLDGKVITTHADLKLTHQASQDLGLSAGLKYNERDNKTASFSYTFLDLGGPSRTAVNTPMSNKRTQVELAGDYRITPQQHLHAGYEFDQVKRWCNNAAANNAQGVLSATNTGYYTTASCVQIPKDEENRGVLSYRLRAADTVNVSAGYTYGRRKADVNPSFYNPMQSESEGFENFGYRAFFDASRTENLLKAGVNWQPTNKFSVGLNGRTVWDDYDSTLGVQKGRTSSLNLDTTYAYAPNYSVSAYVSWQKRTRDLLTANGRNAVAPLPNLWTNSLSDEDNAVGIGAQQKKLLKGKLELAEDLTYSLSKSGYSTAAPYLTGNPATTVPNLLLGTGDTPDIKSELIQFKLAGSYQLSKPSKIVAGYMYQHLKSNDYYYNAYQYGFTPTSVLPTNQQAPSYNVNTIFAAYNYSFQ